MSQQHNSNSVHKSARPRDLRSVVLALRKLLRYAFSTIGGISAETVLLWVLAHYVWCDWEVGISIIAPALSFELCLLVNYCTAKYFVWRDRKSSLLRFHISNTSVFIVKMLFLVALRYFSGIDIVLCNIVAMGVAGLINFVLNDRIVFRIIYDDHTAPEDDDALDRQALEENED